MKLEGKVAIVTGGSAGLGEACVRLFHSFNCKVVIADLAIREGEALAKELGPNVVFIETDVTEEESIKAMIEKTVEMFSKIHIVINSAGVAWAEMTVTSKTVHSSEIFERVIRINVLGTFNVCKFAAQKMLKQDFLDSSKEKGVIINIASIAAYDGQKGTTAYAASKGAVASMTLPLARDLGRYGIRVMALAPGIFETAMGKMISPNVRGLLMDQTAIGRFGEPKEIALISKGIIENEYLTGEVIRIDGGMRLSHF